MFILIFLILPKNNAASMCNRYQYHIWSLVISIYLYPEHSHHYQFVYSIISRIIISYQFCMFLILYIIICIYIYYILYINTYIWFIHGLPELSFSPSAAFAMSRVPGLYPTLPTTKPPRKVPMSPGRVWRHAPVINGETWCDMVSQKNQ